MYESKFINRVIPTMVIRPDGIICYDFWAGSRKANKSSFQQVGISEKFQDEIDIEKSKKRQTYRGVLTESSRKKLSWYINCLVASSKWKDAFNSHTQTIFQFKVNFVTLTLPAPQRSVSDKEIKAKVLSRWIDVMRASHGLNNYVWRAERQYNGNIHFHITTDTYLPYDAICQVWNHFLKDFHFIDEFRQNNDSEAPNSTDVHSVQQIDNLAAYMVKYMSKDPEEHLKTINKKRASRGEAPIDPDAHPWQKLPGHPKWNDPIEGRVWDASMKLKKAEKLSYHMSGAMLELANHLAENYPERCFASDHCLYVDMPDSVKGNFLPEFVQKAYKEWLNQF